MQDLKNSLFKIWKSQIFFISLHCKESEVFKFYFYKLLNGIPSFVCEDGNEGFLSSKLFILKLNI